MKTFLMLDLFSGLGGAHAAMEERGWDIITFDNNPSFKPDVCRDIRKVHYYGPIPDLIWASPPCTDFSKWEKPDSWSCNKNGKCIPDMSLVNAAIRIIGEVNPKYWAIENVRGAVPWFKDVLGDYRKKCGSRYLWGEFPLFDVDKKKCYGKWKLGPTKDRPALRSMIPYEISLALCLSIEREETTIFTIQ